jgi:hypothetical protein
MPADRVAHCLEQRVVQAVLMTPGLAVAGMGHVQRAKRELFGD